MRVWAKAVVGDFSTSVEERPTQEEIEEIPEEEIEGEEDGIDEEGNPTQPVYLPTE